MPEAKRVLIVASSVVVVAAVAHRIPRACPAQAAPRAEQLVTDKSWGVVQNLDQTATPVGEAFSASDNNGRHRVLRSTTVTAPGRYRISVDTHYAGTAHMAIEASGPGQAYGIIKVNLKTGTIEKQERDVLAAGVEPVKDEPGAFRWWMEMAVNAGRLDYNFAMLSAGNGNEFPRSGICRMVLSAPTIQRIE